MAIIERTLVTSHYFPVPGDTATTYDFQLGYHYNDVSMRLVDVFVTQSHATSAEITFQSLSSGVKIVRTFTGPGTVTESVPPGQAAQFGLTLSRGRPDGVTYSVLFPTALP